MVTPQVGRGQVVVVRGVPGPRGLPGLEGGTTTVTVGAQPISGHSAVALDAAGLLVPADCTNPAHRGAVVGVVADAYSPGDEAMVQRAFPLEHSGWTWAAGPVLVGANGLLAQALPLGAVFSQAIAQAVAPTRVLVDVQLPITIA